MKYRFYFRPIYGYQGFIYEYAIFVEYGKHWMCQRVPYNSFEYKECLRQYHRLYGMLKERFNLA